MSLELLSVKLADKFQGQSGMCLLLGSLLFSGGTVSYIISGILSAIGSKMTLEEIKRFLSSDPKNDEIWEDDIDASHLTLTGLTGAVSAFGLIAGGQCPSSSMESSDFLPSSLPSVFVTGAVTGLCNGIITQMWWLKHHRFAERRFHRQSESDVQLCESSDCSDTVTNRDDCSSVVSNKVDDSFTSFDLSMIAQSMVQEAVVNVGYVFAKDSLSHFPESAVSLASSKIPSVLTRMDSHFNLLWISHTIVNRWSDLSFKYSPFKK